MRITFVTTGLENPGVQALAAFVRQRGHEPAVVYEPRPFTSDSGPRSALLARLSEPTPEETAARALATAPDLLAFSSFTFTHRWSVAEARAIRRERRVPTVFGGPHPSAAPATVLRDPAVDAVVVGEGEEALLDLCGCVAGARFGRTDVANAWFRGDGEPVANRPRPLLRDLDALPFPEREPFYDRIPEFERDFMLLTQRGCPFRCSYCEHSLFASRYPGEQRVRQRSVDNVLRELRAWRARGRMRKVFFWDTIFALDLRWLREFAPRYRDEVGLPFECYAHPRTLTAEGARLLADAGCALVRMGVQSVSPATLARVERSGGPEEVRRSVGWLRDAGVPFAFDHILALPGEGAAEQRDACRLYAELRPERVVVHWMTYLPGTAAFEDARRGGQLAPAQAEAILAGDALGFDDPHALALGAAERDEVARLGALMDLIPVLPARVVRWLLDSGAWRGLVGGELLRQVVAVVMALGPNPALRERMRAFVHLARRELWRGVRAKLRS
jgi:radical SAM superfamily enzyme YgiQ (UPF0313 family)